MLAAVDGHEDAELGAGEHQFRLDVVLHQAPDQVAIRQVVGNRGPAPAAVGALEQVRLVVAVLVVVEGHVDRVGVEQVGLDVVDECRVRHARQVADLDLAPALAPILVGTVGHLDQAVVGAGIQQSFLDRRLGQRGDGVVVRHRIGIPGRVPAPGSSHVFDGIAILVAGQIIGNHFPRIAAVVGAPDPLRGVVDARRVVRADQDGRIPVEAVGRHVFPDLRLDVDDFAGSAVVAYQVALLPVGVDDVRVARLGGRLVAVAEQHHEPVGIAHARDVVGARWAALGVVVLGAAVDRVEGFGVVDRDLVELGHRQVVDEAPGIGVVEGLVQPAVGADQQIVRVVRPKSHCMVVDVLGRIGDRFPAFAAVVGYRGTDVHEIDPVELVRAGVELLVVMRASAAGDPVRHLFPRRAAVVERQTPPSRWFSSIAAYSTSGCCGEMARPILPRLALASLLGSPLVSSVQVSPPSVER